LYLLCIFVIPTIYCVNNKCWAIRIKLNIHFIDKTHTYLLSLHHNYMCHLYIYYTRIICNVIMCAIFNWLRVCTVCYVIKFLAERWMSWYYNDIYVYFFLSVYKINYRNNASIFDFKNFSGWKVNLVNGFGEIKIFN